MQLRWFFPISLALTCATASAASSQTIDTRTGESQGVVTTPSFGQTFTVPLGANLLDSFQFFVTSNAAGETQIDFTAYLMRWSGSQPIGPVLFSSGATAASCCTIVGATFHTGGVAVTPGDSYVAFLAPIDGSLVNTMVQAGGDYIDSYAGGISVFAHSCSEVPLACDWALRPARDNEFVAQFSSTTVPEPASLLLLAAGLAGIAVAARARAGRIIRR